MRAIIRSARRTIPDRHLPHHHPPRCVHSSRPVNPAPRKNHNGRGNPLTANKTERERSTVGVHRQRPRGYASTTTQTAHRHHHDTKRFEPTIYALSSAPGRAAIAVVRISGPASLDIYHGLCPGKPAPAARRAAVRTLYEPGRAAAPTTILDASALVLYFPGPSSATGEDVLELHVHGSPAVVKAVLSGIQNCASLARSPIRYAEAGQFTHRAFLNGRLDLTQVEALGDVLAADTEQQRLLSMRGSSGSLAKLYESWRQRLLYARGELEALIDFSEDQHFDESPDELCLSVARQVTVLLRRLKVHTQNAVRGELLRNGIRVSLLGAPNAGKSSLLNRIVKREAAIVSHEAGTTRDVIEIGLDLGGYLCRIGDTAGLRSGRYDVAAAAAAAAHATNDPEIMSSGIGVVEREGMRRAKEQAAESDVVIVVFSLEANVRDTQQRAVLRLDSEVCLTAARLVREKDNVIVVINKSDLSTDRAATHRDAIDAVLAALPGLGEDRVHMISCREAEADNIDSFANSEMAAIATATARPSSPLRVPSQRDPGGIQQFLHALVQRFASLTAAVSLSEDVPSEPLSQVESDEVSASASASAVAAAANAAAIWQQSLGATARHRALLESCIDHLQEFLTLTPQAAAPASAAVRDDSYATSTIADAPAVLEGETETDMVAAAEELRSAADCLAKITGKGESGDVEEVLGVVFEKFCVGK